MFSPLSSKAAKVLSELGDVWLWDIHSQMNFGFGEVMEHGILPVLPSIFGAAFVECVLRHELWPQQVEDELVPPAIFHHQTRPLVPFMNTPKNWTHHGHHFDFFC